MTKMINSKTAVFGVALCAGAMLVTASVSMGGACKAEDASACDVKAKACKAEGGEKMTEACAAKMAACKAECKAKKEACKADCAAIKVACTADVAAKKSECNAGKAACEVKETKVQAECPVMGGAINKKLYVDHDGKRVYVCCKGCIAPVKKDAAKYIKALEADGVTLETVKPKI